MFDKILETYRCLLSCRKKMPGMSLEDAFNSEAVEDLEREYKWMQSINLTDTGVQPWSELRPGPK